jgi:hypothetical protein
MGESKGARRQAARALLFANPVLVVEGTMCLLHVEDVWDCPTLIIGFKARRPSNSWARTSSCHPRITHADVDDLSAGQQAVPEARERADPPVHLQRCRPGRHRRAARTDRCRAEGCGSAHRGRAAQSVGRRMKPVRRASRDAARTSAGVADGLWVSDLHDSALPPGRREPGRTGGVRPAPAKMDGCPAARRVGSEGAGVEWQVLLRIVVR